MAGATVLSAKAYTASCGLVRVFTPEENRIPLQTSIRRQF